MQRDSIGYLIDRCEYLGIPVLFLLSRCPFSLIHKDIYQNSNLFHSFYIDPEYNEYRYDGKANFEQWGYQTNGVMNVNPANTPYNQQKSSTISMNGRYGFRFFLNLMDLVLSLFRILRRNGYHSGNNNDFCAVMSSIYHTTVPKFENFTLLRM